MRSLIVEPIYGSPWLAAGIGIAIVVTMVLITPPTEQPRRRRILIALRSLAAIVLWLLAVRPALVREDNRPLAAALVVAADVSESMTLPDVDRTRAETQAAVYSRLIDAVDDLDDSLSLRGLAYADSARPLPDGPIDDLPPDGRSTDLAAALDGAITAAQGQPLAGVILIGDGTQTAKMSSGGPRRVAETLDSLGIPLWTVPVGPAASDDEGRDVALDALPESYQLFAGNEVEIAFQVAARGLAATPLAVRLSWIDATGEATEFAVRTMTPEQSRQVLPVSVVTTAPSPGRYQLRVSADDQPGESLVTNNRQIAFVDVREGGGRILYLEGTPRIEQTFLRRALRRFADLDVTFRWVAAEGGRAVDLGETLRGDRFDVIILGDVPAAALGDNQLASIARQIDRGTGLLMLAGANAYAAGGYLDSPITDVIPVQMEVRGEIQIDEDIAAVPVVTHPILDLGGGSVASVWAELPKFTGATRMGQPKVAPGLEVLLESDREPAFPMLVIGGYGRGRVAAAAFDSTWRWWRSGRSDAHRRFWRQMILWLLAREQVESDQITIVLDDRRFEPDERPGFSATAPSGRSGASPRLNASVVDDQGNETAVNATTVGATEASDSVSDVVEIKGRLPELTPGIYVLRVATADGSPPAEEVAFEVIDNSLEMSRPGADPQYLRQLAAITAAHGGGSYSPAEVDELIDVIAQKRRQAEVPIVEKRRLGDGPISGWVVFIVFAAALSTEWLLRRRWGLV